MLTKKFDPEEICSKNDLVELVQKNVGKNDLANKNFGAKHLA